MIRTDYLPAPDNWSDWGTVFTDTVLWQPVVRRICETTGVAKAEHIEAGFPGSSAVFVVDREVVVKIFAPFLVMDFHHEVETYQLIGGRLDPYMPELLAHGVYPDQIDWHYIVISFLPGSSIREVRDEIPPGEKSAIAQELGWYIRRLHSTPFDEAKVLKAKTADWYAFLGERRKACLEELRDKTTLSLPVLRQIVGLLTSNIFLPPKNFRPCLLNGDLTEDHLLLEKRLGEWRISGLIDWADSLVGAVEYEWVALWFGLCGQDVTMFREVLKAYDRNLSLDNRFRQRMMAYTFIHRFGPEVIGGLMSQPIAPQINSLVDLQSWLWPPL
ncbi:MAG: aminoglycoside phosphotransferase family protein [Candidatus Promineifilaceae bacterium]